MDLTEPFVYNYTCTSSVLKAYVPMFLTMQVFLSVNMLLYLVVFLYELKYQGTEKKEFIKNLQRHIDIQEDMIPSTTTRISEAGCVSASMANSKESGGGDEEDARAKEKALQDFNSTHTNTRWRRIIDLLDEFTHVVGIL